MSSRQGEASAPRSRYLSLEFMGEAMLLAFAGFLFFYMLWESRDWRMGAWLLPRLTIAFGLPFWIWRVVALIRPPKETGPAGQIMDTGFLASEDEPAVVARRWVRVIGTTAALLGGVWLFGFHVTVPAYAFLYLVIFAKVKWYWAVLPGIFYEAVIVGLYTNVLLAQWNRPAILELLDAIRGVE